MRKLLLLIAVILPQFLKKAIYRRIFGWKIGDGVSIGLSYLDVLEVELLDGARIGHLNAFRRLRSLRLGRAAQVHHSNQIVGASAGFPGAASSFTMEDGSAVMGRHYIDCPGIVEIGSGSVLAGADSQIWSHTLVVVPGGYHMVTLRVRIGRGVYVGARATILAKSIPDGAVVGMGTSM